MRKRALAIWPLWHAKPAEEIPPLNAELPQEQWNQEEELLKLGLHEKLERPEEKRVRLLNGHDIKRMVL